jgi:hypothetical protein
MVTPRMRIEKHRERDFGSRQRGEPPSFPDVWQTKDFKSFVFGSVAKKGVRERISGCVANTGFGGSILEVRRGGG